MASWPLRRLRARPRGGRTPLLQGVYFLLTGVWPLVSMRTFEAVTGPKVDRWLVKTVGLLVAVIGASLVLDRRRPSRGTTALAVGSAAARGGVDVVYSTPSPRPRCSRRGWSGAGGRASISRRSAIGFTRR